MNFHLDRLNVVPELRDCISEISLISTSDSAETSVLPHLGAVLAIQVAGKVRSLQNERAVEVPRTCISGIRPRVRRFYYEPESEVVLINFTATGAAALFGPRLQLAGGALMSAPEVLGTEVGQGLVEVLKSNNDSRVQAASIQNFLRRVRRRETDNLVDDAVRAMRDQPRLRISDLADVVGLSVNGLEKRFRRVVGTTPKTFQTILRFESLVRDLDGAKTLAELAQTHGFYDQSHFTNSFKTYSGSSPSCFFSQCYPWK